MEPGQDLDIEEEEGGSERKDTATSKTPMAFTLNKVTKNEALTTAVSSRGGYDDPDE
jgi:hypothetical protein